MEQIDYTQLIPAQPTQDVVAFAYEKGKFQDSYLIYSSDRLYDPLEDRTKDVVLVTCSQCGQSFHAEKIRAAECYNSYASAPFGWRNWSPGGDIISGDKTLCPLCGAEAKTVHTSNMRLYSGELVDDAWVSILDRLPVDGQKDRFILTDWCVRRCINKQGETRHEVWPYTAWVVEERKIVRLMAYGKYMGTVHLFGHWEQRKSFSDEYGRTSLLMPWDKRLLEGTTAENSKLDMYLASGKDTRLIAYLALWRKHPAAENLLVQGCGRLIKTWINEETENYPYPKSIPKLKQVNWKEKRPAQMLGLTKEEFRQMKQGRWSTEDLDVYRVVRDAGVTVRLPEDMDLLKGTPAYACNRLLEEAPKADFWRILRYLKKQKSDWYTLRDYWRMAEEDGRDLEDSLVRWPRDLRASHDRQLRERQERRDREQAEKLAKRMAKRAPLFQARAEVLGKLSFQMDGLLIRPCTAEKELVKEGKSLHHCVATYAGSHASGKTAILFIRKADDPDKPYFTLEFDEKNLVVKQNRGLRNCDPPPEVKAFVESWLAWVKAGCKQKVRLKIA